MYYKYVTELLLI